VRTWMLLVYKVPNEPTAGRVYVWRKLKRLGAALLHDSVWVLPATPRTREQLRWLATEIAELDGDATVWESRLTLAADEQKLVSQFTGTIDSQYREILAALKDKDPDLAALSRRYQQVRGQDYFNSDAGQRVHNALAAAAAANGGDKP
jgi:DNA-binding transcriptional regulator PaaX